MLCTRVERNDFQFTPIVQFLRIIPDNSGVYVHGVIVSDSEIGGCYSVVNPAMIPVSRAAE